jgi:FtsH-binding integral membrane protein
MNMQYGTTALPGHVSEEAFADGLRHAMRRVYLWMTLGLLLTGTVAFLVSSTPLLYVVANPIVFFGALIAELIFVIVLSARVMRMSPATAVGIFLVYAALNGVTMSLVFAIYTSSSIAITFFVTACLFGAMSIVGYTTTIDLTRLGGFLLMALIGLIIGSIANFFFASSALYWILTYVGIIIFIGLTAYNTQRVKRMTLSALQQGDALMEQRIGIIGALSLYLDFVNLFLLLLRLSGRRR